MNEPTRTQLSNKVLEIADAPDVIARRVGLDDLPRGLALTDGAKEAAILTFAARSHDFEFEAVMTALDKLSKVTDWSHPFMIAHTAAGSNRPGFDWREAPLRRYASFKDFYRRELESTWGKWENLQHTWAQIVKGEITEEEGRRIVLGRLGEHGRGRPKDRGSEKTEDATPIGRGRIYILARLDRDRPDLAARVRAKTMSANAAAIEAGFRKKSVRKKLTAVEREIARINKLTKVERRAIWQHLEEEFG